MKIYSMDIQANQISVFQTRTKTKVNEVFEDVEENLDDILSGICSRADDFPYDDVEGIHAEKNRENVRKFRDWMEKIKQDNNLTISEGDVWITLFTEEIPGFAEQELAVHEMEIFVGERLIHRTGPYTCMNGVIHQALTDRHAILHKLSLYAGDVSFDGAKSEAGPVNRNAVEMFDYWMSHFALHAFEPQEIRDGNILIRLSQRHVLHGSDFPEITAFGVRHEVLQPN